MIFEYKNSRLSVVDGAPEKPKRQPDDKKAGDDEVYWYCVSCSTRLIKKENAVVEDETKLRCHTCYTYEQALASCRRIPVADEDQAAIGHLIIKQHPELIGTVVKEGELYHVDVEVEFAPVPKDEGQGGNMSIHTAKTKLVARIKQPQLYLGDMSQIDTIGSNNSAHSFTEGSALLSSIKEKNEEIMKINKYQADKWQELQEENTNLRFERDELKRTLEQAEQKITALVNHTISQI